MKKYIYIALVSIFVAGCSILDYAKTTKEDLKHFSVKEKTIYYNDEPIAILQKITYSLDGEDVVKEMNFNFVGDRKQEHLRNMIQFISKRHQDSEIEVEIEIKTDNVGL